jgi:DNA repair protein NreA
MLKGKGYYLKQLTSQISLKSADIGLELEGSTPPSVFIGSYNYPKILAGPMLPPCHGDTSLYDSPERWIPEGMTIPDIVDFRVNLVRGKKAIRVWDTGNRMVEKLIDISLAEDSIDSELSFTKPPSGQSFNEDHLPHGPSAEINDFKVSACRWEHNLEKAYYDSDLKAADAVNELHSKKLPFSRIQKALSVGALGVERARRLVPTRWAITACDTILADSLLDEVRHNDIIDCYRVYEFDSLRNHYAIILTPTPWQYEWMEAFLHLIGSEELIFSDFEGNIKKNGYSSVGGCYYSCKFGVLEALVRQKKQSGAIILREAYEGYVPLGVFNVRENVRQALLQKPSEHHTLNCALKHVSSGLRLPLDRFVRESTLLRELLLGTQTTLAHLMS